MHLFNNRTSCASCALRIYVSRNDCALARYPLKTKSQTLLPLLTRSLVKDQLHHKEGVRQNKNASKVLNGRTAYILARLDLPA
jgi:hypothetical protein